MGNKMKPVRNLNIFQPQKIGLVLVGCFLSSLLFLDLSKPSGLTLPTLSLRLPSEPLVPTTPKAETSGKLGRENATTQKRKARCDDLDCEKADLIRMRMNSSTASIASSGSRDTDSSQQLGNKNLSQERRSLCDDPKSDQCQQNVEELKLPNNSSPTILDSNGPKETLINSSQLESGTNEVSSVRKPLCDVSNPRSDLCEMVGGIRIHGNSSSVTFITSSNTSNLQRKESYRIRPYPRKGDQRCLSSVREVTVRSSQESPNCTVNHTIPAVLFSIGGFTGNLFHDFTDVLVPLFLTSRQFNREVQFLVTNLGQWWINKYMLVFKNLSKYKVIDFDKDQQVRCFSEVIVGLRYHKELGIDPKRAPNNYSILDFNKFIRNSYSLEREFVTASERPRLLIISRNRTRAFLNIDEIVELAQEIGYETVISEPRTGSNIAEFARIVNSVDVMMGVHGAGLTNLVFLPAKATVIQIVPLGGMRKLAMSDFGYPAKDMRLRYLHYEISEEESSLIDLYPRDHPVFRDPMSFHKNGWNVIQDTFLDKQNVRLNITRFRAVLLEAFRPPQWQ